MKNNATAPMLLNLQMLADPMEELLWEFSGHLLGQMPHLQGCMLYCGQHPLAEDMVYLVPEDRCGDFPADAYPYITTGDLEGRAPHIRNINQPFGDILNLVLATFQRYRHFEIQLGNILAGSGSLTDLCRAASDFFENPVYIHDDFFAVVAISHQVPGMLDFEFNEKTGKVYIPLWLINEFKFDNSYHETLTWRHSAIWGNDQYPFNIRSLFVNLWSETQYCGRVLVNEIRSLIQPGQFWALEYFAQYAIKLMLRLEQSQNIHHTFEETLISILSGKDIDNQDLRTMLSILDWSESDTYMCLVFQEQIPSTVIRSADALRNQLAPELNSSISFFYQQNLCTIINMAKCNLNPRSIRSHLAPMIRDSYMYSGFSNPIPGIRSLQICYTQAKIALNHLIKEGSSNWMLSFSACALPYILESASHTIPANMLVHPVLPGLKAHDNLNGTQYYETLRVFLMCERSIPKTASSLIIHRTTLSYRLEKLLELAPLNLDDPDLRLYLLLSFHILDQNNMQSNS